MPFAVKLSSRQTKGILKKAPELLLPRSVLYRSKQGFDVPLAGWFRNELREMTYDLLLSKKARSRGIFDIGEVERLLNTHVSGKANY